MATRGVVQGGQLTEVGGLGVQRRQRLVVAVVVARRILLLRALLLLLVLLLLLGLLLGLLLLSLLLLSLLLLVLRMLRVLRLLMRIARERRKVGGLRHIGGGGVLVLHAEDANDVVVWGNNGALRARASGGHKQERGSGAGQLRGCQTKACRVGKNDQLSKLKPDRAPNAERTRQSKVE